MGASLTYGSLIRLCYSKFNASKNFGEPIRRGHDEFSGHHGHGPRPPAAARTQTSTCWVTTGSWMRSHDREGLPATHADCGEAAVEGDEFCLECAS